MIVNYVCQNIYVEQTFVIIIYIFIYYDYKILFIKFEYIAFLKKNKEFQFIILSFYLFIILWFIYFLLFTLVLK